MIESLPNELVNLIAAGEVIDSFVAVVRELVENAIDAGANFLRVELDFEQWSVRVRDNGQGMGLEDLKICALPHTTSKIHSFSDFLAVESLGFRGQALHSLCQVSQLSIATRPQDDRPGWQGHFNSQGDLKSLEIVAIAGGSIVTVKDLFANLPQRRQSLPSQTAQLKAIQNYIQTLALCHPQLTWQVTQKERPWLTLSPGQTALQILPQILKTVKPSDLKSDRQSLILPTETPESATLNLLLGLPDRLSRHRPDWIKIAINQRPVNCPELEQAVINAYHRTLPRDRFPVAFLHLQVSPNQIDWNRHPAKTEIYLRSLEFWQNSINNAVIQCLQLETNSTQQPRVNQLLKVAEKTASYQVNPLEQSLESLVNSGVNHKNLKAIAQVNQTYIVAEHESGFWLIEQHIAQERVLYEQLQDHWHCLPLEKPLLLNHLNQNQVEQLQRLQIEIEPFGEEIWAVRSLPFILVGREDAIAVLRELSLGGDLATAQATTACRTAIKNGTVLGLGEMQNLLNQWQNTRNPRTCPHGRPIYLALDETSLARFFRRNWMIGKS
ncbi:MAG: DNA mismatch repair endonuclease MutL [Microcystaceae cyanobacterium]